MVGHVDQATIEWQVEIRAERTAWAEERAARAKHTTVMTIRAELLGQRAAWANPQVKRTTRSLQPRNLGRKKGCFGHSV